MKKKKKGSTFLIVVVVMAIIFTTGTTVLSLTASNYKMRINESKRLQNLYEADSGLDVVENIIIKTSQEAVKYADKKVKMKFTNENDIKQDDVNALFKEKFYEFLGSNKKIYNSTEVYILEYLILKNKIINSTNENGTINEENLKDIPKNKNYIISIEDNGYKINIKDEKIESITIDVNSNFETVNENLKNKRTVSTTFKITAPDYKSGISTVDIYPVYDGYAITADGNMDINGGGSGALSISGDIWVKGGDTTLENNPNFTFDKYKDGIKISNSKFNIDGNIYTANTFSINNKVIDSEVKGNVYAKNVYIGKTLYGTESTDNNITFKKNIIVNNDLAMNSTNSKVTIENNFYGINDKTTDPSNINTALNSSSIIINELEGSNLTVKKDAYILGVAYLNATDPKGNKYQTGESVAVKGNYLAYTDAMNFYGDKKKVTLEYYTPLQLLESVDGSSSADAKADYFIEYFGNSNKKYGYKDGGVKLEGKVASAGASVKDSNGKIQKTSISKEDMEIVIKERDEFVRNVFAMGDITGFTGDLYGDQKVLRTVENQIAFDKVNAIQEGTFKNSNGTLIFKNSNGSIILKGDKSELVIENNEINEQPLEKHEKGLIVTNGDIKIKGSFNFTGTIITTGNITFEGSNNKEIKYDPNVVRGVIADNYDAIKDIFNNTYSKGKEVKISSSSEMYNSESFLKQSLWKIER